MKPTINHPMPLLCAVLAAVPLTPCAFGQDEAAITESTPSESGAADLAQELANPVADLISIPIQANFDSDIGPVDDGFKLQTNIQPVIPFDLNEDWNVISRTIAPVIYQEDIFPGAGSQFGLGDVNLSLFLSPKEPSAGGVTWGAGPVFLLPTATDSLLGAEQWGAGPSLVALRVQGPWTYGMLANHLWSFAGDDERPDLNNTFVQPFVAYTTPNALTLSLQSETSYNWTSKNWSVPINVAASQLVKIGKLPVSLQAGIGYWAESPDNGPEGFRFRLQANAGASQVTKVHLEMRKNPIPCKHENIHLSVAPPSLRHHVSGRSESAFRFAGCWHSVAARPPRTHRGTKAQRFPTPRSTTSSAAPTSTWRCTT